MQRIDWLSRYDHSNKGELSIKEWFNVLRIQNHIDTSLDMVRFICLYVKIVHTIRSIIDEKWFDF